MSALRSRDSTAGTRLAVSAIAGVLAAIVILLIGGGKFAPLGGWDVAAGIYLVWMWSTIWPLGPDETPHRANRDDPNRLTSAATCPAPA